MKVELNRRDLLSLLYGISPNYELMEHPLVKPYGVYYGGHCEEWRWHGNFQNLNEQQLWELYLLCKESYRKNF